MNAVEALRRTVLLCRDFVPVAAATDAQIVTCFLQTRVAIVSDAANLQTASGQTVAATLVSQIGMLGCHIRLVMPDVPVIGFQPPVHRPTLREGLLDYAADLIPGAAAESVLSTSPEDLVLVLGDTKWQGSARYAWRVAGTRWAGSIMPVSHPGNLWAKDFPIGAIIAGLLGAAEVFKASMREFVQGDFTQACVSASVALGPDDLGNGPLRGDFDIISGGAITNAALFALLRVPELTASARIFEPDTLDFTNLNRYPLARRSMVAMKKVAALKIWERAGFSLVGREERFTASTQGDLVQNVVVGVDHIPTRWVVQERKPEWLVVGATSHFFAISSEHTIDTACVGCVHREDDGDGRDIPTVGFVSGWAGLMVAARIVRHLCGVSVGEHQALDVGPLRLDLPLAHRWWRVPFNSKCPLGHAA